MWKTYSIIVKIYLIAKSSPAENYKPNFEFIGATNVCEERTSKVLLIKINSTED